MSKPAADHDGFVADPCKGVEEAMLLHSLGHHEDAVTLVDDLAAKHPGHQMVLYVAGRIHLFVGRRAGLAQPRRAEEMERHLLSARDYLAEAKRLFPNCIDISLLLAMTLHESSKHDEADDELQRGIGIEFPVDPAESNIVHSIAGVNNTRDTRVNFVRKSARTFSGRFEESVCNDHVPRVVREVLELDANERQGVVKALKIATDLAKRYHYSSLAQHIRAYMKLRFARSLDATINRRKFVLAIVNYVGEALKKFDRSIVLVLFLAKLCFVLRAYETVEIAGCQGLAIEDPIDPNLEDIPPGSVNGEEYVDRLSSVRGELRRLMGRLVIVATKYWYSMTSQRQDSFLSVRLAELHRHYHDTFEHEHWVVRTITDAMRFSKKNKSWRIWICPFCVGKKLPDTTSLFWHMCNKHPAEKVLSKLQFVVVPEHASEDDYILEDISVCEDSDDSYIFRFKNRHHIFEHLFTTSCFEIQGKSFAELRDEKCKAGSMALQKLKQKLVNLPEEKLNMLDNTRPEIEDLWHEFVKASALDYRVAICPLVKTFIWTNLMKFMREDDGASKITTNADIDEIFPNILDVPGSNGAAEHGPKSSNEINDHRSGDDQQTVNMKPSCLDVTMEMDEEHERSEVHVDDENSDAMLNGKPSEDPIKTNGYGSKLKAAPENVGEDLKYEVHVEHENSGAMVKGTSDQPAEEMSSVCRYKKSIDVLKKCNADEDLFFFNIIVQSLWNLRRFCHEILRRPPACFHLVHDGPCVAGKLYEIFFALEKTEHFRMAPLLTDVKITLCEIIHDTEMFHKMQAGKNFASEIMATIIEGLHKSETYVHFPSYGTSEDVVIDPASCTNFICRAHDLFGITLKQLMSCNCGERFSEEYMSIFHELDASSLYTTKTESIAQLPVLMDHKLNHEIQCNKCTGIVKHVDCFISRGAHFFITVLKNWKIGDISKATMSEAFFGIASPFDITLLYKGVILPDEGVQSSTKYNLVMAICHVQHRYVCFVRDQEKWHIYDIDTVKVFDSWEELLESYREVSLRPEVLFFEVITAMVVG